MQKHLLVAAAALAAWSCPVRTVPVEPQDDEYAVYAALMTPHTCRGEHCGREGPHEGLLVIAPVTDTGTIDDDGSTPVLLRKTARDGFPGIRSDTLDDFIAKNWHETHRFGPVERQRLKWHFSRQGRSDVEETIHRLEHFNVGAFSGRRLDAARIPASVPFVLDGAGDWEDFHRKHPCADGVRAFSRVGISARGDEALLVVAHTGGFDERSGRLVWLKRAGSRWITVDGLLCWIS